MNYEPKIAKSDLIHGEYYAGRCRNSRIARWDATTEHFVYWRTKFNSTFLEKIRHPADEQYYDVFVVDSVCTPEREIPLDSDKGLNDEGID